MAHKTAAGLTATGYKRKEEEINQEICE